MNRRKFSTGAMFLAVIHHSQKAVAQTVTATNQSQDFIAIERASAFNPTQMYGLTADLFTRSYFAELRALPNWGVEHLAWSRNLASFSSEMLALLLPISVTLEAHLSRELARQLTENELSELSTSITKPEIMAATGRLSDIGASWKNLVLIQMVQREPKFYSASERAQAKALVSVLRSEVAVEQVALKIALKPLAEFLESSSFSVYQTALGNTFMADAKSIGEIPEKRRGFELLMQRWHNRLKAGA